MSSKREAATTADGSTQIQAGNPEKHASTSLVSKIDSDSDSDSAAVVLYAQASRNCNRRRAPRLTPARRRRLLASNDVIGHLAAIAVKSPGVFTCSSIALASTASKLRKMVDDSRVVGIEDCWSPPYWEGVLENIRSMRAARDAPVDSMGAEVFMNDPGATDSKAGRLHVLVSLMLSSQTRDEVNHAAMTRLRQAGLSVQWLRTVPESELAELIKPVGFWRRKAQYLKAAAALLETEFGGDIPGSVSDLCRLPGVGPKMAHLTMNIAWRQVSGIGVDTHVHRIANRLGWVQKPTGTPELTRQALEAWLPRQHWTEINLLLVGLGQQLCTPVAPRCGDCLNRNLCPSAAAPSPTKKKPRRR